jgi:hypothetical protein
VSDALTSKEQCREQFDMWAENLGLCMDELFMSSTGVPENPFEDQDTKSFYMAWLAAWEACEVLRSAHEPETVRTTDATLNAGLDQLRAIANGQVVKISPLQASLVLDYVRALAAKVASYERADREPVT